MPLLAEREAVIRFPKYTRYRDRQGPSSRWTGLWPFRYYSPLAPVFKRERKQQRSIRRQLKELHRSGLYRLVHCRGDGCSAAGG